MKRERHKDGTEKEKENEEKIGERVRERKNEKT